MKPIKTVPRLLLTLIAALVGGLSLAPAQEPAVDRPGAFRRTAELPEFLRVYDVNEDGVLSEEERQVARDIRDERLDSVSIPWDFDGDGVLSSEERRIATTELETRIEEKRCDRFDEADRDADGFLSDEEFRTIPAITRLDADKVSAALAKLDGDGDGKVSKEEFLAALRDARPVPIRRANGGAARPVPVEKRR